MKKNFLFVLLLLFVASCNKLDFVYSDEESLRNPLYEKVFVIIKGDDLPYFKSYVNAVFGNKNNTNYDLLINVNEKQTKRSVQTNQAISNLSYELEFFYSLKLNKLDCLVYSREHTTAFSFIPKSSGYNYGTDASLDKKYELAIKENLNKFISDLSEINLDKCK